MPKDRISKRDAEFALNMRRLELRYSLYRLPLVALVLVVPFGSAVWMADLLAGQDTNVNLSMQVAWGLASLAGVSAAFEFRLASRRKKKIEDQRERIDSLESQVLELQGKKEKRGSKQ